MNVDEAVWEDYLLELRQMTNSDFCAVAMYDASARQTRWMAASGNTNEKFRNIVNRSGKGISGEVIRIGRTVQRTFISDEQRRSNDSIMLAEHLAVAAAAPIRRGNLNTEGILLIGRRSEVSFSSSELLILENACSYFMSCPEELEV